MIVLEFRFPAGRWHATAWGTHVNEGIPEWPPSPWRLCRALWATWFSKHQGLISEDAVRSVIELLIEGPLPRFELPPAVAAHTRHYMPLIEGKKESKTKVFDTFVQVAKADSSNRLLVSWNVELSAPQRQVLQNLLESMSYFGRAESLIEARLLPADIPPINVNAAPIHTGEAATGEATIKLLAPLPQREFSTWRDDMVASLKTTNRGKGRVKLPDRVSDCLLMDTDDWKGSRWSQPPGSRWVVYSRPEQSFRIAPQRHKRPHKRPLATIARFLISSNVLPDITQSLSLGERFHRAMVKWSDNSPIFSGCDESGQPLKGHPHAYYLAEPSGLRGEIRYITVYTPGGFGARERAAMERLRQLWDYDDRTLNVTLASIGNLSNRAVEGKDRLSKLFGPARVWQSMTPFVPTRHPKARRTGIPKLDDRGIQIGSPEHDLLRLLSLMQPGIPAPKVESVDSPALPRRVAWLEYQCFRRHGAGAHAGNRGYGFRLTFPVPITGPIALGYAAHFGLGLFCPVDQPL